MDSYVFKKELLLPEEYNRLRENVGWGVMDIDIVRTSFKRTLFGVSVYDGERIIGSGRVVGDGGLCFYLQDVMVDKEFQKKGIGFRIVSLLMEYLEEHAADNSYVGLLSAKGVEHLYEKFGFVKRPNDFFGPGMSMFWGRKGEMTES